MSHFNEPKSPLTSARVFDKRSDAELADWLDTDAQAMDGQPGRNNHVAATRAAAERLRRLAEHDAALIEKLADELDLALYEDIPHGSSIRFHYEAWLREKARQRREEADRG